MKVRQLIAALEALRSHPDVDVVFQDDRTTYDEFDIVLGTHEYPEGDITDAPEHAESPADIRQLQKPVIVLRASLEAAPRRATEF
jgi:hypothetical protein